MESDNQSQAGVQIHDDRGPKPRAFNSCYSALVHSFIQEMLTISRVLGTKDIDDSDLGPNSS